MGTYCRQLAPSGSAPLKATWNSGAAQILFGVKTWSRAMGTRARRNYEARTVVALGLRAEARVVFLRQKVYVQTLGAGHADDAPLPLHHHGPHEDDLFRHNGAAVLAGQRNHPHAHDGQTRRSHQRSHSDIARARREHGPRRRWRAGGTVHDVLCTSAGRLSLQFVNRAHHGGARKSHVPAGSSGNGMRRGRGHRLLVRRPASGAPAGGAHGVSRSGRDATSLGPEAGPGCHLRVSERHDVGSRAHAAAQARGSAGCGEAGGARHVLPRHPSTELAEQAGAGEMTRPSSLGMSTRLARVRKGLIHWVLSFDVLCVCARPCPRCRGRQSPTTWCRWRSTTCKDRQDDGNSFLLWRSPAACLIFLHLYPWHHIAR
jgi:hypothetical protein